MLDLKLEILLVAESVLIVVVWTVLMTAAKSDVVLDERSVDRLVV